MTDEFGNGRVSATSNQVELLVKSLEQFRYIWDINFPDFHDRVQKASEWRALADAVGLPLPDVKRTYETMRKNFRTEHAARMEELMDGSETPPKKRKIYPYYHELKFLIPTLKIRSQNNRHSQMCNDSPPRSKPISSAGTFPMPSSWASHLSPPTSDTNTDFYSHMTSPASSVTELLLPTTYRNELPSEIHCTTTSANTENEAAVPIDNCSAWAVTAVNDLRTIKNPLHRRRIMHRLSGILVEEIEKQHVAEGQTNGDNSECHLKCADKSHDQ